MQFHYTDINGLRGILSNKQLWLTDSRHLNDATEAVEIFSYLEQTFQLLGVSGSDLNLTMDTLRRISSKIIGYAASFSSKPDLLSQWRGYCPDTGGYSLGFTSLHRESLNVTDEGGRSLNHWLVYPEPQPCVYSHHQKELVATCIAGAFLKWLRGGDAEDSLKYESLRLFHKFMIHFKHVGFQEELESRLSVQIHGDDTVIPFYRDRSGVKIPYLKAAFQPECLREIVIGPINKTKAASKLDEFMAGMREVYPHVKIRNSSIPFKSV